MKRCMKKQFQKWLLNNAYPTMYNACNKKILMVDDDEEDRLLVKICLMK